MEDIKEFWGSVTGAELLIVAVFVGIFVSLVLSAERIDKREEIRQACLYERVLTSFECKVMSYEVTSDKG